MPPTLATACYPRFDLVALIERMAARRARRRHGVSYATRGMIDAWRAEPIGMLPAPGLAQSCDDVFVNYDSPALRALIGR